MPSTTSELGVATLAKAPFSSSTSAGSRRSPTTARPDEVMALSAEYQAPLIPIIQKHSGPIDKFLGDGVIATFGVAQPSPAYAADATVALDEALAEIDRWNAARHTAGLDPVAVNAALTIGPVIFDAVGDDTRLEYTVIGEPVNLAAKLEKHNKKEAQQTIGHARAGDPGCVRDGARPRLLPKGPSGDAPRLPGRWHHCARRSCRPRVILGDKALTGSVADIRQLSRAGVD